MATESTPPDYTREVISGLELFIFGRDGNPNAPLVFVTHGRGGRVEHVFDSCRDLVKAGLIAIAVEQRNHGRRLLEESQNRDWSQSFPSDLYGIFAGTALDVSLLLDMIPARLGLATDCVGMTGFSLGGHATFIAMTLDSRIKVGVPVIGGGHFRLLMETRIAQYEVPAEQFDSYYPPALQRAVEKYDPYYHPERFADRPLLMLNGGADTLVPAACNQALEGVLRPHYTKPDHLKLSIYPGVGHEVPPAMWQEAVAWLSNWLPILAQT